MEDVILVLFIYPFLWKTWHVTGADCGYCLDCIWRCRSASVDNQKRPDIGSIPGYWQYTGILALSFPAGRIITVAVSEWKLTAAAVYIARSAVSGSVDSICFTKKLPGRRECG